MYKISINRSRLALVDSKELESVVASFNPDKVFRYPGRQKFLLPYIDMMEKQLSEQRFIIHYSNLSQLKNDFRSLFKTVRAAGGTVYNSKEELLFILKNGYWDLPKGKIDPGETKRDAAIREVSEETGLKKVRIDSKIGKTRHVYKTKNGRRAIKLTHWYLMRTDEIEVFPQAEEGIIEVKWLSPDLFFQDDNHIYFSNLKALVVDSQELL